MFLYYKKFRLRRLPDFPPPPSSSPLSLITPLKPWFRHMRNGVGFWNPPIGPRSWLERYTGWPQIDVGYGVWRHSGCLGECFETCRVPSGLLNSVSLVWASLCSAKILWSLYKQIRMCLNQGFKQPPRSPKTFRNVGIYAGFAKLLLWPPYSRFWQRKNFLLKTFDRSKNIKKQKS